SDRGRPVLEGAVLVGVRREEPRRYLILAGTRQDHPDDTVLRVEVHGAVPEDRMDLEIADGDPRAPSKVRLSATAWSTITVRLMPLNATLSRLLDLTGPIASVR